MKLQSIRSAGLSYKEATAWSLSWRDFLLFFLPDVFGYGQTTTKYWSNQSWLKTTYLGIIPFIMSLFLFLQQRQEKAGFFFSNGYLIILALGGNTPYITFSIVFLLLMLYAIL